MGDETWANIQMVKSKRESFREKLKKRKAERETIFSAAGGRGTSPVTLPSPSLTQPIPSSSATTPSSVSVSSNSKKENHVSLEEVENNTEEKLEPSVDEICSEEPLPKKLKPENSDNDKLTSTTTTTTTTTTEYKMERDDDVMGRSGDVSQAPVKVKRLLSAQSIRERETKKVGEEIMELLSKPTAKEQSLAQRFRSQGGAKVQEFCPHGTREECLRSTKGSPSCGKLHFRKIIQKHTDESLGDCSFLNTCFHMDTCRYVHYEVDHSGVADHPQQLTSESSLTPKVPCPPRLDERTILFPPQWIQCDLRFLDMSILGKFAVIMADPPWDIHMELPYGTMSDDEMRQLSIPIMQDEGLIFLWVTGRAMELGRECLSLWGYERVDEIIWVKTNQLQRIIRTGRTGHWLNHGKEHCLVGMKGNPKINRWLDADVIVAEVRATSHKPDEIYGIIERLSPGTRKLELFGRPHNVQPNWVTLGNQLEGVNLLEEDLVKGFREHYPDGVCVKPPPI